MFMFFLKKIVKLLNFKSSSARLKVERLISNFGIRILLGINKKWMGVAKNFKYIF